MYQWLKNKLTFLYGSLTSLKSYKIKEGIVYNIKITLKSIDDFIKILGINYVNLIDEKERIN